MISENVPQRLMGLDVGDRRIGLAVSYCETDLIMPVGHINRSSLSNDIDQLFEWSNKRLINAFVVGIPYRQIDSRSTTQVKKIQKFIQVLRSRTKLEVHTIDESYTTTRLFRNSPFAGRKASCTSSISFNNITSFPTTISSTLILLL